MRIGLMIGPERGRYRSKVERMQADARWAEEAGLATVWIPQIPDEFDVLTAATMIGAATTRIEVGTAVVPVQPRHPVALAQQVLSVQAVCEGRLALGLGVSHHWVIDEMLGLPYERPIATMRSYLDVLDRVLQAPARSTWRTSSSACTTRSTSPTSRPRRYCSPHSAPACCSCAASGRTAPSCGWLTSVPSGPTSSPP